MKESEFKKTSPAFAAMRPSSRRGVLDDEKKRAVLWLVIKGASRREAAGFVQCAHTTIGRTAARDPDFAAKLSRAEAAVHLRTLDTIHHAAEDPKYWRAAAWMLERRCPEEYARRDPNSFTADQVMSLLARLYSETLPLLPAEKVGQFQELFDEALQEVEAKSGREPDTADEGDEHRAHRAPRNGLAAANGHVSCKNGEARVQTAAHSGSGHQRPDSPPAADAALRNGGPDAQQDEHQEPHAEREEYVEPHAEHDEYGEPHAGANDAAAPAGNQCEGGLDAHPDRAAETANLKADMERLLTASRFEARLAMPDEVACARRVSDPLFAALRTVRRYGLDPAGTGKVSDALDSAQLHQPLHQGVGTGPENDDRNPLYANDLQQQSTDCTSAQEIEGRCNNDVMQASPSPA